MKTMDRRFFAAGLALALLTASRSGAVTVGQIDTFEDGTTQGWIGGLGMGSVHPAPPANALGGPAGASDNYLHLTSVGGNSAGSRLSVLNLSQWAGNYSAAGVGAIAMDLKNLGSTDLALRLVFEDPLAGPPNNIAFSKNAFLLPAGGVWTHAVFPIGISDLQAGLGTIAGALTNTTAIRLYHSDAANFPNPFLPIPSIVAQLGVDNIQAVAAPGNRVPESGWTGGWLLAALVIAAHLKRRAASHR